HLGIPAPGSVTPAPKPLVDRAPTPPPPPPAPAPPQTQPPPLPQSLPQSGNADGRRPPKGGLVDRLARGSMWTLTTGLAAMISIFLTTTLAARVLHGDNGYSFGIYTLATSIIMTAAIIAHFGLPRTVVRLVAEAMANDEPGIAKGTVQRINRLNVGGG